MKLSKHKMFIYICIINIFVLCITTLFPNAMSAYALDSDHLLSFTWLTSMFTHAGMRHFFGNTLFVLPWAWYLEPKIGGKCFLKVWLATGMAGSVLWLLTPSMGPLGAAIGSSAACMGILGCAVMLMEGHWLIRLAALFILCYVGLEEYQLTVYTSLISDGVGHAAHVGGLISGIVSAHFIVLSKLKKAKAK